MVHIIAVANQKGGVGKTTTTLNLGAILAQRQRRVLLIDLDPQASLTAFLGLDPYNMRRSSYSLLMYPNMTLARVLRNTAVNIALIPGSIDLATAAIQIVHEHRPLNTLRALLHNSRIDFDYVLIDTPPSLSVLTVIGLLAAHEVIIPAQCNLIALPGIRAMLDILQRIRTDMGNPDLKLRGILPTFFDPNSLYAGDVLKDLRHLMPGQIFQSVIPYDTNVVDAPHHGRAVVDFAPESSASKAYQSLVEELLIGQPQ